MFDEIFSLGLARTKKQALGFYIGHLVIGVVGGAVFTLMLASLSLFPASSFDDGVKVGAAFAFFYVAIVSFGMLHKKKLFGNFKYVLLVLLALLLASVGGALLGLILPAYLSTKSGSRSGTPS